MFRHMQIRLAARIRSSSRSRLSHAARGEKRGMPRFRILLLVVPLVAAALAAGPLGGDSAPRAQTSANPLAGLRFYVRAGLAVVSAVAGLQACRPDAQGGSDLEDRARAPRSLARPIHAAELPREGEAADRPRPGRGHRSDLHRAPRSGHVMRSGLHRRRSCRGRPHPRLVRRPGRRDRERPRGDRLRARLARHDRLSRAEQPRRPPAPAALRGHGTIEAAERDHLPRGRRLGLGGRVAHRQAAARDRDREGAGLPAQRHPLRLDEGEHPARARHLPACRRQALHHQHGRERSRPGALQERRTAHQRLVQPRSPRARAGSDHQHLAPEGRRLPLDQPAGLRAVLPGSPDRLVSAARADLRALRHQLGEAAARRALRASQALPAQRVRDSVAG